MSTQPGGARPYFLHPGVFALVVAGGAVGTALRATIEDAVPAGVGQWPWATFTINLVGSFLLGVLLALLSGRGPDEGKRRLLRVTFGTGVLGGFTTYSTFIVEVDRLLRDGFAATGTAYAVTSVVLGIAAAFLGMLTAGRRA